MGVIKPKALLPFALETVGTYSCHGVEPGMRQGETSAKINQDRGCVCYPFGPEGCQKTMALFCVFDGHGASSGRKHAACDARQPTRAASLVRLHTCATACGSSGLRQPPSVKP